MSLPRSPDPAKLVISLFMKDKGIFEPAVKGLQSQFGDPDIISSWMDFNYTSYYESETGAPLFRRVVVFQNLIDQENLPEIKLFTNKLEKVYSTDGRRRINIDPGYLLLERFVLATGKNFTHRIHLKNGIYADLTLIYQNKDFHTLPWTYPDYADFNMLCLLRQVREKYKKDLKTY